MIRYLTRGQQKAFLGVLIGLDRQRDRLMFQLMLRYGLRVQEVRDLELKHLKLEDNSLYIRRVKRGMSQYYPLRKDDMRLIERWIKTRAKMTYNDSPYLFITAKSGQLSSQLPLKLFEKYSKEAGIEGHSCHSLRHSCAVNLLDGNVDLYDVKMWLGHSNISSTMEYLKIGTLKKKLRMSQILDVM